MLLNELKDEDVVFSPVVRWPNSDLWVRHTGDIYQKPTIDDIQLYLMKTYPETDNGYYRVTRITRSVRPSIVIEEDND